MVVRLKSTLGLGHPVVLYGAGMAAVHYLAWYGCSPPMGLPPSSPPPLPRERSAGVPTADCRRSAAAILGVQPAICMALAIVKGKGTLTGVFKHAV